MTDIVYPDAETLLTGKKSFHILDTCRNTKQMISIGASRNTYHLFVGEVTTKREWLYSGRPVITMYYGGRRHDVIHPF